MNQHEKSDSQGLIKNCQFVKCFLLLFFFFLLNSDIVE